MTTQNRSFVEELEVAGHDLLKRVSELVQDGNARRVTISAQDGDELLSMPLTSLVVAGGLVTLSAPALGALAALVTRVKVEVTRAGAPDAQEAGAAVPTPVPGATAALDASTPREGPLP